MRSAAAVLTVQPDGSSRVIFSMVWPPLIAGAAFLSAGVFLLLVWTGRVLPAMDRGPWWALPLLGGMAVGIGLFALIMAIIEPMARKRPQSWAARVKPALNAGLAIFALSGLALAFSGVAFLAWQAEPGSAAAARFSGGVTGSIYEHRVVWTAVAVLLDLIALPFWLGGAALAVRAVFRGVRKMFGVGRTGA